MDDEVHHVSSACLAGEDWRKRPLQSHPFEAKVLPFGGSERSCFQCCEAEVIPSWEDQGFQCVDFGLWPQGLNSWLKKLHTRKAVPKKVILDQFGSRATSRVDTLMFELKMRFPIFLGWPPRIGGAVGWELGRPMPKITFLIAAQTWLHQSWLLQLGHIISFKVDWHLHFPQFFPNQKL